MSRTQHTTDSPESSSPGLQSLADFLPDVKLDDNASIDSGIGSTNAESDNMSRRSSTPTLPQVSFTPSHLKHLNQQLEKMEPIDILRFSKILFPNLCQSTAFGLTGLVTLDMLSRLQAESSDSKSIDLIFLDTLYHFAETYELVDRIRARYPHVKLHIFKPNGTETVEQFEQTYGARLYEESSELYDWVAKVEPQQRAFAELGVAAVFTGRRRSQGGQRGDIPVLEVDEERGTIKINPLVNWSFAQVQAYIREHDVPYNTLLDRGYKSIGDWHSTSPVGEGEGERAGRWKGQQKTECGIHNKQSRYAQYMQEMAKKALA
ncbi:hypothetical protein P8C59_009296 [Phyllachora maydis]|uniref:phosphoadenylyl-sulfate reductase (thioredoxin) n=1 Tax=Phyllachora maydis TaxID=1825666 RepID=A0AAD9ICV5_9PEZI|nr:hypothetical protein P8C59_009296 [Phyllachora maydis]